MKKSQAQTSSAKAQPTSKKPQSKSTQAQADLKKAKAQNIKTKVRFSKLGLEKSLLREAKVLKISEDTAKDYIDIVVEKVAKWAKKRGAITEADINQQIAKEIKKYNQDIAFIYENRGKII